MEVKISHVELIALSEQVLAGLQNDYQDFAAMDAVRFTQSYLQDFKAAIDKALSFVDDETVQDEQTIYTQKVEDLMTACRKAYKLLKYFVEKAFAESKGMQNKFGLDDYAKAARSQARMIVFMNKVHTIATQYSQELLTHGYTQQGIDELNDLHEKLRKANIEQDRFKGQRMETTQERHEYLEVLYTFVTDTCKMGKILYEDDNTAKYKQYVMYKATPQKEENADDTGDTSDSDETTTNDGNVV